MPPSARRSSAPTPPATETDHGRSTAADRHAVLITSRGVFTPSLARIDSRPVTSVDHLARMLTWLAQHSRDRRAAFGLTPAGRCGQVWIVSPEAVDALGWLVDPGDYSDDDQAREVRARTAAALTEHLAGPVAELAAAGWVLRGDHHYGHTLHLVQARPAHAEGEDTTDTAPLMVDVIVAPYAWTMAVKARLEEEDLGVLGHGDADTGLPDDEYSATLELGRRLAWCVDHLDTLPAPTSAGTGAAVYDRIMRARRDKARRNIKNPGVWVDSAGPLPPLDDAPPGDIEPGFRWAPAQITDAHTDPAVDLDTGALRLVHIDAEAAYLASMGMVALGYGPATQLTGPEAAAALAEKVAPFGLWQITAPPLAHLAELAGIHDWALRMPPHPRWTDPENPSTFWVTTEGLRGIGGILSPIDKGGTGLDLGAFQIHQGWTTPEQARVLEPTAKVLSAAYKFASGLRGKDTDPADPDPAMRDFVKAIYRGYIGRMANPELWSEWMAHHHQRLWYESIHAHATNRTRRKAAEIHTRTGLYPLRVVVDALVYAAPVGLELADPVDGLLGRMRLKDDVMIPGPEDAADGIGWLALLAATDRRAVAATVDKGLAGRLGRDESGGA